MAKPSQIHLILIRSGSTEWDEGGRVVGDADLPMSSVGRARIDEVLDQLDGMKLSGVYCASDEAGLATGELVAATTDTKVKKLAALNEVGLGLWQGLLESVVEERYPSVWKQWSSDPTSVTAPEGETLGDAEERIVTALAKSLDKIKSDGEPVVGVVLRPIAFGIVRCWLNSRPLRELWEELGVCAPIERHSVSREMIRLTKDRVRAAAS